MRNLRSLLANPADGRDAHFEMPGVTRTTFVHTACIHQTCAESKCFQQLIAGIALSYSRMEATRACALTPNDTRILPLS